MRKMKRWLALALALCMAVPNVAGFVANDVSAVYAEEASSANWDEWAESLSEDAVMAVRLTGDEQKFDGNKVLDVSADYAEGIKTVEAGSIIMRFKANSLASTSVILGARNSAAALPTDVTKKDSNISAMMLTTGGKFRFVYSYDGAEIAANNAFTDGNWHTVVVSGASTGKNIRLTIDGVEKWSISNRSDLAGMFSRQSVIDLVTIGGHKSGNSVVAGFNGTISDVIVTKEAISDADAIALSAAGCLEAGASVPMGSAIASTMMNISLRDNTWLFTGGEVVQGGFDQTRGIRNYVGQFEEYVRWVKIDGSPVYGRQRYTFNTGTAGRTITDVVNNFEKLVATFKTKAAVYMVGVEDYSQGTSNVAAFKTALKSFIDQSLALKDHQAFAIIQKPFAVNDVAANANIEIYCAAVDEVVETYSADADKYARIMVVDHYTATKDNAGFKANKLINNKLNAKGHLEIGKQFAATVVNFTGSAFPNGNVTLNRVEEEQPDEYLNVLPTVTAGENSLSVVIPTVSGVDSWKYELDMDGTLVSGTAEKNTFDITGLVEGKAYVLKIQSADGEKQLVTTMGTISNGAEASKYAQTLDANQQKIAARMAEAEPMTWLFMGDSITHASGLTYGYDGIAQIFEEFVKEGLGRSDDIVLNTAVANANTITTIEELDQRLTNYNPDVISLMIGTNDCSSRVDITVDGFRENMITILDTMKTNYPDAVIILRSMTPFFNDANREPYREAYMNVVKELAEEYDTIYVDQYTALAEATATYTWLPKNMFTDNLHPEANGHRVMTNMFIKACGLWTEDLPMTNLFYEMGITEESNAAVPGVVTGADQIGVSVTDLESKSGLSLGDVVLKATSNESGQTYEVSVKDGENYVVLNNLPENKTYTVEVSACLTTAAKNVTFAAQEVTLNAGAESVIEVLLSSRKAKDLAVNAVVGTLSVDGLVAEGEYAFTLCEGSGSTDNPFFKIAGNELVVAKELVEGQVYSVRVKAVNGNSVKEAAFEITAVGKQLIFEKEDMTIASGSPVDLSSEDYAERLLALEEGTIVVKYVSTSTYGVQSLFSIANGTTGNNNRHFHVYITPAGRLGCEIRNDSGMNYHVYADNAVVAGEENAIALKADAENGVYKLFANGELVATVNASTLGGYKFVDDITGTDTVQIGATKRGGSAAYSFGGTVNSIQVYGTALNDEEIIKAVTLEDEPVEIPENLPKAGSISVTADSITADQPFAPNTAGSNLFRIPALITLDNGDLLAVADARWQTSADWGGLDTIASVSSDNGKTWQYSFPIFFPDSNLSTGAKKSTTIIDPVIVQGNDGTIYCVVDVNPTSITTGDIMPAPETGFVEIDGVQRLVLTGTYTQPTSKNWATYGNPEDYEYYVGDFNEEGFAKVFNKADNSETDWIVDEWYNIYKLDRTENAYKPLTQTQVNSDTIIQQNAYYAASELHVYNTGYLWLVTSTDNGRSWSAPTILNTQIKREGEVALLASPGQGMVASNGDIIIPFYDHGDAQENASIIWSSDNGKTWTRSNDISGMWSSENEVVELYDGVLRMFFRNGNSVICYADITKENGVWTMGQGVRTSIPVRSGCNVTAINCSETINGKKVVMVACPSDPNGRNDGNIYTFLINEDNTMELYHIFSVNKGAYAYSCMTEMANGNIGLLWEPAAAEIRFDEFVYEEVIGQIRKITLDAGSEYVEEKVADSAAEITTAPDTKIATITSELTKEESVTLLRDYNEVVDSSLTAFTATSGAATVKEAEFTFTANGDYWQIYNEAKGVYLTNANSAATFFANSAADMKVEAVDGEFRISKSDGKRYIIYYFAEMNFNSNSAYNASFAAGSYELSLLKKQDTVSADDIVPGYKAATEIESGEKYLIAYLWGASTESTEDDGVIILYPANGVSNQTKLVGDTVGMKKNVITITGVAPGETSAVVGDITYQITVTDPRENPAYDKEDLAKDQITYTTGSEQPRTGNEGPIELAFDNDVTTFWHSEYNPTWNTADCAEHLWVEFEFEEATMVDAIRYLPRPNGGNGDITGYRVEGTTDGTTWTTLTTGTWTRTGSEWKLAEFTPTEVVGLRLVATSTYAASGNNKFASAAELRVRTYTAPEPTPTPSVTEVFTDVAEGKWYVEAVQYVYDNGLMSGNDGLFNPTGNVTRAQVVTTLYRLAGEPEVTDFSACEELSDVAEGKWYTNAICWAYSTGVTTGNTNTMTFNINTPVTRQQLASFFYRYADYMGYDIDQTVDISNMVNANAVSSYALTAVKWAVATELISGSETTDASGNVIYDLKPQATASRAQLAAILQRFCDNI